MAKSEAEQLLEWLRKNFPDWKVIEWLMEVDPEWSTAVEGEGEDITIGPLDAETALSRWKALEERFKSYYRRLYEATPSPAKAQPQELPTPLVDKSRLPRTVQDPNGKPVPVNWSSHIIYRDRKGKRHILYLPVVSDGVLNDYTFKQLMEQAYGNQWEEWAQSKEDSANQPWQEMEREQGNLLTFTNLLSAAYYNSATLAGGQQGIMPDGLPPQVADWAQNKAAGRGDLYGGLGNILAQPAGFRGALATEPTEQPYLAPVVNEALVRQRMQGQMMQSTGEADRFNEQYKLDLDRMKTAFERQEPIQLSSGDWWDPKERTLQVNQDLAPADYSYEGGILRVYAQGQAYFIPSRPQWASDIATRLRAKGQYLPTGKPLPKELFKGLEIPYSNIQQGQLIEGPDAFYVPGQQYNLSVEEIEKIQKQPLGIEDKAWTPSPEEIAAGLGPDKPQAGFFNQQGKWVRYDEAASQALRKAGPTIVAPGPEDVAKQQKAEADEWERLRKQAVEQSRRPQRMSRF